MYLFAFIKGDVSAEAVPSCDVAGTLQLFLISIFVLSAGPILLVFFLPRLLAWMDARDWIVYRGDVPTYGSLGNAFLEIQAIFEPQKQYVLGQKEEEEQKRDQEDVGGSRDPTLGASLPPADERADSD